MRDLLGIAVIVGIVLLVVWSLMPTDHSTPAWRVKCGSNLRQIGQAMRQYAMDHDGQFPRTRFDPSNPTPRFFTGFEANDPFAADGPEANDVTATLWLVLRETDLVSEVFLCPRDEQATPLIYADFGGEGKTDFSNFPGRRYLSYSLANPYPSQEAIEQGWEWTDDLPSSVAIAADINPGSPELLTLTPSARREELRSGNSPNHSNEGQNVLYADGSVRFVQTPFTGWESDLNPVSGPSDQHDNIYTAGGVETLTADPPTGGVAIISPPLAKYDSVLLPVAAAEPGPQPAPRVSRNFYLLIVLPGLAIGAVIFVIIALLANRARRRKLERNELPEMPPRKDGSF